MDPCDLEAVLLLKRQKAQMVGEVKRLIGFLDYYRPFIQGFSCVAKPTYELFQTQPGVEPAQYSQRKTKGTQMPSRTL